MRSLAHSPPARSRESRRGPGEHGAPPDLHTGRMNASPFHARLRHNHGTTPGSKPTCAAMTGPRSQTRRFSPPPERPCLAREPDRRGGGCRCRAEPGKARAFRGSPGILPAAAPKSDDRDRRRLESDDDRRWQGSALRRQYVNGRAGSPGKAGVPPAAGHRAPVVRPVVHASEAPVFPCCRRPALPGIDGRDLRRWRCYRRPAE